MISDRDLNLLDQQLVAFSENFNPFESQIINNGKLSINIHDHFGTGQYYDLHKRHGNINTLEGSRKPFFSPAKLA